MSGHAAIVGVGGLGAPAAAALALCGVAHLTLIDADSVEPSNLPRQPLFGTSDVGRAKVEVAARRLREAHPGLDVAVRRERLDASSGHRLLEGHAVVLDGTDSLESKVLLNRLALDLDVPLIHAGAIGLQGQLLSILPHRTACLRCLFVELPDADELPSCQQAGVLGPVVGAVGVAAAREALAVLRGRKPPLANRMAIFDGCHLTWRQVELRPNARCPACRAAAPPPLA